MTATPLPVARRLLLLAAFGLGLGLAPACAARKPAAPAPVVADAAPQPPPPPPDLLGDRPELGPPPAYLPPVPTRLDVPGLGEVWLLERHALPLVAVSVVVPSGSAADPKGKGGLAALTAEMMEQGAGDRGALALSQAAEGLGATLSVGASFDWSAASLTVLRANAAPAVDILADVVARPRFEAGEWKRTQPLWVGELKNRAFEPREVALLAGLAALFGDGHPYGHPTDGTVGSIEGLKLDDVRKFHKQAWRPDLARVVVAGDLAPDEARSLLATAFDRWKAPADPAVAPAPPGAPKGPFPRLVLVDRPGSPQTMLRLVWPGPAASDPSQPVLQLLNVPLGGSFTSRLNQNLREDKGYTYGVRTSVPFTRGPGAFACAASVQTEVTGAALAEILKELRGMADVGPTAAEGVKAQGSARNDDVETYEGVFNAVERLSLLAGVGLAAERDAEAARARDAATIESLVQAARSIDADGAIVVAVGDRGKIEPQLAALGLPAPQLRDPEGKPVKAPGKR